MYVCVCVFVCVFVVPYWLPMLLNTQCFTWLCECTEVFVCVCVCLYLCMRACVCMCACDWLLLCVMMCVLVLTFYVIWTCKTKLILKPQRSTITFKSFILAQVHFCTLLHKTPCSLKREHKPHKNDANLFGIKHSFIWYLILYWWSMIYEIISNFLSVKFFLTHSV